MSLRPVVIEQFPGLDLRRDPGDSAGAIDLANVTLEPGRVRVRDGSALLATLDATNFGVTFMSPVYWGTGTPVTAVVVQNPSGPQLYALKINGTSVSFSTGLGSPPNAGASSVSVGTTSGSFLYVGFTGHVFQWNGTAWSDVTGTIGFNLDVLALSPTDNRLVACTVDTVRFSNPGAPTTFAANNFVLLTPGDGEYIQSAVTFNNQVFIFKNTKFFVFYGNSTDSTGSPIFNYRAVASGIGVRPGNVAINPHPQSVCVADDGVYFIGARGIYRTTGGAPVLMSQKIQPYFNFVANSYWQGGSWPAFSDAERLMWLDGKLYFSTGTGIFVWDRDLDAWSWWNLPVGGLGSLPHQVTSGDPAVLCYGSAAAVGASTTVKRMDLTLTADAGTAIVSRYRLPFETYGTPGEKRMREVIVEGSGALTVGVTAYWSSTGITKALALGIAPAINDDRMHNAWRGRAFSLQLSAASGAWSVNRVQASVADAVRPVNVTV